MNLEEYLAALSNCPDESVAIGDRELHRLTLELGVYDNYFIFLDSSLDDIFRELAETGRYRKKPNLRGLFSENGVGLQFKGSTDSFPLDYYLGKTNPDYPKHLENSKRYKTQIILHAPEEESNAVEWARKIKPVLVDLLEFFNANKLSFCCVPTTVMKPIESSLIIYYP